MQEVERKTKYNKIQKKKGGGKREKEKGRVEVERERLKLGRMFFIRFINNLGFNNNSRQKLD